MISDLRLLTSVLPILNSRIRNLLPSFPRKHHSDGLEENHEVKLQGPVVDILKIEIHPLLERNFIAVVIAGSQSSPEPLPRAEIESTG
jgi:hypothetical protein